MICPNCGYNNPFENNFCGKCGIKIKDPSINFFEMPQKPAKADYLHPALPPNEDRNSSSGKGLAKSKNRIFVYLLIVVVVIIAGLSLGYIFSELPIFGKRSKSKAGETSSTQTSVSLVSPFQQTTVTTQISGYSFLKTSETTTTTAKLPEPLPQPKNQITPTFNKEPTTQPDYIIPLKNDANVRDNPEIDAKVAFKLKKGEKVKIIGERVITDKNLAITTKPVKIRTDDQKNKKGGQTLPRNKFLIIGKTSPEGELWVGFEDKNIIVYGWLSDKSAIKSLLNDKFYNIEDKQGKKGWIYSKLIK